MSGRRSFTLVEVMMALCIASMACTTCFQVFHTVRRLNARARFYAQCLPFVRAEFTRLTTAHAPVGAVPLRGTLPGPPEVDWEIVAEELQDVPLLERVTLELRQRDAWGSEQRLSFQTYVSRAIRNKEE